MHVAEGRRDPRWTMLHTHSSSQYRPRLGGAVVMPSRPRSATHMPTLRAFPTEVRIQCVCQYALLIAVPTQSTHPHCRGVDKRRHILGPSRTSASCIRQHTTHALRNTLRRYCQQRTPMVRPDDVPDLQCVYFFVACTHDESVQACVAHARLHFQHSASTLPLHVNG